MEKAPLTIEEQLAQEKQAVADFLAFFEGEERDLSVRIYDEWTAKDVLGHVASWHLSFARNLLAAVENRKPNPFKGSLTEVNEVEVARMALVSAEDLVEKIQEAQALIEANIGNPAVTAIAYKKGSRDYSPLEHLEVVRNHVRGHLKDVKAKY
jgi:hypothetical protein